MRFTPKTITLKDGRTAILRAPETTDAAELLRYLRTTAGETDYLIRTPEECTMTEAQEAAFIESLNASEWDMMILCEVEGRIAGNCQLSCKRRIKSRHRGEVAIALLKEFWGLGIGTAMMQELIAEANRRGLMQLELEFIEGNTRARALYEKLGFRIVALRPNATRLPSGKLLHEYIMVLAL